MADKLIAPRFRRIRLDLESRGVAPAVSEPMAQRLAAVAATLSPEDYAAVLDSVAAAYGAPRAEAADSPPDAAELARLLKGFDGELRKLEEGLRTLSAYVERMRSRSGNDGPHTLH